MASVVAVSPGDYEVGHDTIPNASPAHRRRVAATFWIDAQPLTWSHFETFVVGGGYGRTQLWAGGGSPQDAMGTGPAVDARCRALLDGSRDFRRSLAGRGVFTRSQPLTGVTWFEAAAIAAFFGARLPFEVEWEVAIRASTRRRATVAGVARCVAMQGTMQEWTADAFTPVYWRADHDQRGQQWVSGGTGEAPGASTVSLVSVRGSAPGDVFQHPSARIGRSPEVGSATRGFRRVWDVPPAADMVATIDEGGE